MLLEVNSKIYTYLLISLILLGFQFAIAPACSADDKINRDSYSELHRFHAPNDKLIGILLGIPIPKIDGAYKNLIIVKSSSHNSSILYEITESNLIDSSGIIEETISPSPSYGFRVPLARETYIVVSCCAVGTNVMDDITIEWNTEDGRFQLLRTP